MRRARRADTIPITAVVLTAGVLIAFLIAHLLTATSIVAIAAGVALGTALRRSRRR